MSLRRFFLCFLPPLLLICWAGLCFGGVKLPLDRVAAALVGAGDEAVRLIVLRLRLPRVAAGLLAGAALATAGVLLQSVTANDLAGPNLIGVNSGAGLAVIVVLSFFPMVSPLLPLAAFVGAFAAAMVIAGAAARLGGQRTAVILTGIAVTTVLSAAIQFLSLLDEGVLAQYSHFSAGSLKGVAMGQLALPAAICAAAFAAAMALSHRLGLLCLGDEAASAMGVNVGAVRVWALACAAACAASAVSFAGLLGFVGLVVPHMARLLVGRLPGKLLPASAVLGAAVVVLADLLGRTLFAPSELPVGILMSLVGAPYFLILLCRRSSHG